MKGQQIKEEVKERYGKIALAGKSSEGCCAPSECSVTGSETSLMQIAKNIGCDAKESESVPEASILGVGCGAPVNFADIKEGEVVVDIGSGGGIDIFLSARSLTPALLTGMLSNLWLYWSTTFVGTSITALIFREKFVNN